jgi:hypothetical protein
MLRICTICLLTAIVPLPASAQNEPPPPTETIIKLLVDATPAPKPGLRYQLLPELREMHHGNPYPEYLKCFMEQQNFFFNKQSSEEREKLQTAPLDELPDLRAYGGTALKQADYAARCTTLDWQTLQRLKSEGINFLLPEIQQLRMLAGALKVRLRGEIKDRRFDDAVRSLKTMYALSRHLGEHPTLIGNLVGMAIANIATGNVDELLAQPGCPNLYWAFATLPDPFFDMRRGLEGRAHFPRQRFRELSQPNRAAQRTGSGQGARQDDQDGPNARARAEIRHRPREDPRQSRQG